MCGTDSKFDPYRVRVHGAMQRLGPEVTNSDIASHRLSGGDRSREKHAPNPKIDLLEGPAWFIEEQQTWSCD